LALSGQDFAFWQKVDLAALLSGAKMFWQRYRKFTEASASFASM